MKYSQLLIQTLRELPADAVAESHRLMLRSSMLRKLANGLFAYLPLGLRSFRKVAAIIRQEMEAAGSLEIKPSVVVPAGLWEESGRWHTMGDSMLRAKNRLNDHLVISPTAEEAATAIVRGELASYKQLPISVFQINTKYRDEIRPRYGVMRAREFTMKDAYSYHRDVACLDVHYRRMDTAYRRIFARCGLVVIAVKADSGAMGGEGSEEFMVESAIGDNTLLVCRECAHAANVEKAACKDDFTPRSGVPDGAPLPEKIDTPDVKSIAQLCAFLAVDEKRFIKTLIYRACNVELDLSASGGSAQNAQARGGGLVHPEAFVAVCVRGDIEVNEVKLASALKASAVELAADADVTRLTGAPVGFAGPVGLTSVPVIADKTVTGMAAAICGALEKDKHYINVEYMRDFVPFMVADVRTVAAGDRCAECGGELYEKKGNELGHIFKLGDKYTKSMNVHYLDENGKKQIPVMGTYGIGVDRTLASIIEEHHDAAGIIWPASVAPFHVHIVPIKYEGEVRQVCDELAAGLEQRALEVLLDDRGDRPGVKFTDADLIGIPLRVTVGDKNLGAAERAVELKDRESGETRLVPLAVAADEIAGLVREKLAALERAGAESAA
ncbi:MAG: proline--tRNA ligase [Spirochaetaceae bacterium]|jgi:prolyl-tRNA synthetase|nr:proline--tRNA ligase [Spirochaetaceae bacterium]